MTDHKKILVESLRKAIAYGKPASQIARESGVNGAVISKLLNGQQQDLMAGYFFSLINSLPDEIKNEAMIRLGLGNVNIDALIPHLSVSEITQIIGRMNLTQFEVAHILEAIACSLTPKNRQMDRQLTPDA
jgi:hypothetical protein